MFDYRDWPYEPGEHDDMFVSGQDAMDRAIVLFVDPPVLCSEIIALRGMSYRDYLRTDHWQQTRSRALSRSGGYCQMCETQPLWLEVHHLTYVRLGCEAELDLIALCPECHKLEHRTRKPS